MTGRIIYFICDGCKKTTLQDPDLEFSINSERDDSADYHLCADCADSDWFYCKMCRKAHQFECPVEAAKAEADYAEFLKWEAANAEQLAEVAARNDALPF